MRRINSKKGSLVYKVLLIAVVINSIIVLITNQLEINQKELELNSIRDEVAIQNQRNAELKDVLNSDISEDYIAQLARDKLGYAMPGEVFYEDISGS